MQDTSEGTPPACSMNYNTGGTEGKLNEWMDWAVVTGVIRELGSYSVGRGRLKALC